MKQGGGVVTWGSNSCDANFLAGDQQIIARSSNILAAFVHQIYSTPGDAAGVQQIYSTRKRGVKQDGSVVTWGVNARGDV